MRRNGINKQFGGQKLRNDFTWGVVDSHRPAALAERETLFDSDHWLGGAGHRGRRTNSTQTLTMIVWGAGFFGVRDRQPAKSAATKY